MIFKKIQILILVIIAFSACQNNNGLPVDNSVSSADYSLSSAQNNGFSFKIMTVLTDSVNQNINSDFIVLPQLSDKGDLVSPFLVQPHLKSSYALSKQFDNQIDAELYYNAYTSFSETGTVFDYNAIPIKPFQIWIVKTNLNRYGKILIISTSTTSLKNSLNAVVNFKAGLLK